MNSIIDAMLNKIFYGHVRCNTAWHQRMQAHQANIIVAWQPTQMDTGGASKF